MGEAPENTLSSFERALQDGATFVEFDVWASRDGEIVIIHDATVERTTGGRGRVTQMSLKEIKALDAGYRFSPDGGISYPYRGHGIEIPTLEEFFVTFPQAKAIIEIKQVKPTIVRRVIETVCRWRREETVLLATEKDQVMREIRQEIKAHGLPLATGFSYGEVAAFMRWVAGGKGADFIASGQAFQIPCHYGGRTLVSAATLKAAHEQGTEVFVWTINDAEEMERLLGMGADGIITDYPARLRDLSAARRR